MLEYEEVCENYQKVRKEDGLSEEAQTKAFFEDQLSKIPSLQRQQMVRQRHFEQK